MRTNMKSVAPEYESRFTFGYFTWNHLYPMICALIIMGTMRYIGEKTQLIASCSQTNMRLSIVSAISEFCARKNTQPIITKSSVAPQAKRLKDDCLPFVSLPLTNLCIDNPRPCQNPQNTKFQLAPCQSPPKSMVSMRLMYVRTFPFLTDKTREILFSFQLGRIGKWIAKKDNILIILLYFFHHC